MDPDRGIDLKITKFDYGVKQDSLYAVGEAMIHANGLAGHHKRSADALYENGIKQIVTQGFVIERVIQNKRTATEEDRSIDRIECEVKFRDVTFTQPTTTDFVTRSEVALFPQDALDRDAKYSGSMYAGFDVVAIAHLKNGEQIRRTSSMPKHKIAKIPIIVGSNLCHTRGKSKEALAKMKEDPDSIGGYLINTHEYAIDCTESTTFNQQKIFINEGYRGSRVRSDYISKPGDGWENSDMSIITFNMDDTLTVDIRRNKLMGVKIPFFLLFRAMGWNTDKEILDNVVMDYTAKSNKGILNHIRNAMNANYKTVANARDLQDQAALRAITDLIPEQHFHYLDLKNNPDKYQNAMVEVLNTFDRYFFTHIGTSPAFRHEKLKFLAAQIRRTLMVYDGHIPQTDRDSFAIKRVHSAGDNLAKTFKSMYNQMIALTIKSSMKKVFDTTPFSQVSLNTMVSANMYPDDFERALGQAIVNGSKATIKIRRKPIVNRLGSQLLHRKNDTNTNAILRQVTSTSADSAKQSERASIMRRIHPSQFGYICLAHSPPEGEKVGINKQIAMFATIAPSSPSGVLRKIILEDPDVVAADTLTPVNIFRGNYSGVYVNGLLIAFTEDSISLVNKYRKMRRRLQISMYTTIYRDETQNDVHFSVDIGRMIRPLIIVYNSHRDSDVYSGSGSSESKSVKSERKSAKTVKGNIMGSAGAGAVGGADVPFEQHIGITQQDIMDLFAQKKTIDDMVREQKVEYIAPEEQLNCLVAPHLGHLNASRHDDLKEYTHCDIPQSLLGITALTSVFGHHNQAPRVTYQTSQVKQTCGQYVSNWPFRIGNDVFLQYKTDVPLVDTKISKHLYSNGNNIMLAIACYTGYNQEDSLIINRASIARGLFDGSKFNAVKEELEQKEELGMPDLTNTEGIKAAVYTKLGSNAVVPPGTLVVDGDVIIGKTMAMDSGPDKKPYLDRSRVYRDNEPAIVQRTILDYNENGSQIVKLSLRLIRSVEVGDKFSSRAGQKGIGAILMNAADMPHDKNGICPDMIFNPHGIPSRMTVGHLMEGMIGTACAMEGIHYDGTMFKDIDIEAWGDILEKNGMHRYGYKRLYSGITGEFMDTLIFHGPIYYQRLQKFVKDAEYAVNRATTDAMTKQPMEGQSSKGGIRVGEMERDGLVGNGGANVLQEKFFAHSDGMTSYKCRCGKDAIVNKAERLFKCTRCKSNADIMAIPSSWTAKLLEAEINSCNVGVRMHVQPFAYEQYA